MFTNKPYKRNVRLSEQIKVILSDYFTKKGVFLDGKVVSLVTITSIDLSQDLRHAKVFITSIDNYDQQSELVDHLNKNANTFKFFIGKKIRTKNIPKIKFYYDNLFFGNIKINK